MQLIALITMLLIFTSTFYSNAQVKVQFTRIEENGETITSIPRIALHIPFETSLIKFSKHSDKTRLYGGFVLKNEGIVYRDDVATVKDRALSLSPCLDLVYELTQSNMPEDGPNDNVLLMLGAGADYFFHQTHKTFVDGKRRNKTKNHQLWGDQINKVNFYARAGINIKSSAWFFVIEYYFKDFLNKDFKTMIDGVETYPYRNLKSTRLNVGLTFIIPAGEHIRKIIKITK